MTNVLSTQSQLHFFCIYILFRNGISKNNKPSTKYFQYPPILFFKVNSVHVQRFKNMLWGLLIAFLLFLGTFPLVMTHNFTECSKGLKTAARFRLWQWDSSGLKQRSLSRKAAALQRYSTLPWNLGNGEAVKPVPHRCYLPERCKHVLLLLFSSWFLLFFLDKKCSLSSLWLSLFSSISVSRFSCWAVSVFFYRAEPVSQDF